MSKNAVKNFVATIAMVLCVGLVRQPAAAAPEEVAPGLKVGDLLDQSNAQLAKDLLPPEILKHYEKGEYRNRIVAYPTGNADWEKSFLEGTEKNARQLEVDARGTIVEKGTGKQPAYVYGIPFPLVDAKDPN